MAYVRVRHRVKLCRRRSPLQPRLLDDDLLLYFWWLDEADTVGVQEVWDGAVLQQVLVTLKQETTPTSPASLTGGCSRYILNREIQERWDKKVISRELPVSKHLCCAFAPQIQIQRRLNVAELRICKDRIRISKLTGPAHKNCLIITMFREWQEVVFPMSLPHAQEVAPVRYVRYPDD